MNLKGRSFVKLVDLSNDEIQELIELSLQLKQQRKTNKISAELEGKRLLQLMQKGKPHLQLLVDTASQGNVHDRNKTRSNPSPTCHRRIGRR
jgi:ornithine carbamoyltransferase